MISKKSIYQVLVCIFFGCIISILRFTTIQTKPFYLTDLFAYWSATKIYFMGLNPYDPHTVLTFQEKISSTYKNPAMVWNPPFLFVIFWGLFSLPESAFRFLMSIITYSTPFLVANALAVTFSVRNLFFICVIGLFFTPISSELYLEQYTCILLLIFLAGIYFYQSQKYFISGVSFSLLLLKPHVFLISGVFVGVTAILNKRWGLFLGALLFLAILFSASEFVHPGIINDWINRKTWPVDVLGANSWSLCISCLNTTTFAEVFMRILFLVISCLIGILLAVKDPRLTWENISFTLLANSLFIPYGFTFDQMYLLIPLFLAFFAIRTRVEQYLFLLIYLSTGLINIWIGNTLLCEKLFLGWFLCGWVVVALYIYYRKIKLDLNIN